MKSERTFQFRRLHRLLLALATAALPVFALASCNSGSGNDCSVNSDCVDSSAAEAIAEKKCPSEVYCIDGTCHGECRTLCEPIRTDTNPCDGSRLCAPSTAEANVGLCTMKPIVCSSAAECPVYLAATDGASAEWTCEAGICFYPGWMYATR